jgi:hypothetical protein
MQCSKKYLYSITSSASASNLGGISTPSFLARPNCRSTSDKRYELAPLHVRSQTQESASSAQTNNFDSG